MNPQETVQEASQGENPETPKTPENVVAGQPEAPSQPVHESIAEAILKIIPEAQKVASEVLNLARLVEVTVKSHLAIHAQNQSELAVKNELSAKLNPSK